MTDARFTPGAIDDLRRLMDTHELPDDTPDRVAVAVGPVQRFPRIGQMVRRDGRFELRYVLGPWRWMLLVYRFDEDRDLAEFVAVEDARSSREVTRR